MSSNDHYDVIIIGSGAGGGTLAYKLALSGKRILLCERVCTGYQKISRIRLRVDTSFGLRLGQRK